MKDVNIRLWAICMGVLLLLTACEGRAGNQSQPQGSSSQPGDGIVSQAADPLPEEVEDLPSSQTAKPVQEQAANLLPDQQTEQCLMLADKLLMTQAPQGDESVSAQVVEDLRERILTTLEQGPQAPGGIEELTDQSRELVVYPNDRMIQLLGLDSRSYQYERANAFFESWKAGQTGSLVVVGSGDPLILLVEVLRAEKGVLTRYVLDLDGSFLETVETVTETETAWQMGGKPEREWGMRFAKYGLVPEQIANQAKPSTPEEAAEELKRYLESNPAYAWLGGNLTLEEQPARSVAGEVCYVFSVVGQAASMTVMVNQDLSRFYEIEQVDGTPVLQIRPATSPEQLAGMRLPEGPIGWTEE